jgi:phospholipase/lecithinase/hemolysin
VKYQCSLIIVSGDSYSTTGFDIQGSYPSTANPLGNPAFPGQTTDGGENWVGFLIAKYNTSLTLSFNFAVAGATTDASIIAPGGTSIPDLRQQVALFSNRIASKPASAPWESHNTLAGIWMGINDLGGIYAQSNLDELLSKIMTSYFGQLEILYKAGIRKFMLLAVPREFIPTRPSGYHTKANLSHYSHAEDARFYRPRERSR